VRELPEPRRVLVEHREEIAARFGLILGATRFQTFGQISPEEVLKLLLQGRSTWEIAVGRYISPYTVQEHCRAIFDKVGVRSRRELVGRVFYQQYEPRRRAGLRPGPSGWFAAAGGTGEPEDDPPPGRAGAIAVQ
jgi:hypothetical protein